MSQAPVATPPTAEDVPSLRQLIQLVREDRNANLKEWTYPGFQALLAYRLGRFRRGIRSPFARRLVSVLHRHLAKRAVRRYGIELHDTAIVGRRVRIIHQNGITVHAGAVIGDDCWIRQGAQVGSRAATGEAGPVLGQDVRLGVNVSIPNRVIVGDGARLGPNCVVCGDLPEGSSTMPPRQRKVRQQSPE